MSKRRTTASVKESTYAFPEFLAETDWLAQHLNDPNVRVLDTDVSEAYRRAHIQGAVTLSVQHYLKDPINDVHIMHPAVFRELMESLGIGDETVVVAYDDSCGLYAARLWWALQYYGHSHVKVLNGGWKKWFTEGHLVSRDVTAVPLDVTFTPRPNRSLLVTMEELLKVYDSPDSTVWDVRSRGEFTGEKSRHNRRSGHIPSAVHMEWIEAVDPKTHTLRPAHELRSILADRGITPERSVITY